VWEPGWVEKAPSWKVLPFLAFVRLLCIAGYSYDALRMLISSSAVSASLKFSSSSRNRMFSGPM
jgi:hypothetical protein